MSEIPQEASTLQLTPVGEIRSPIKTPVLHAGQVDLELQERLEKLREHPREVKNTVSELVVFDPWGKLLDGVEAFSHIRCSTGPT